MNLTDYEETAVAIDAAPRPNASQAVAAKRRRTTNDERLTTDDPEPTAISPSAPTPKGTYWRALGLLALAVVIGYQFTTTPALRTPAPTAMVAPTAPARDKALFIAPTSTPVLAPTATLTPIAPQNGAGDVLGASQEVPAPIAVDPPIEIAPPPVDVVEVPPAPVATPAPAAAPIVSEPLRIRAEDDCGAEHGRCTPPCTAEHGRCSPGDK